MDPQNKRILSTLKREDKAGRLSIEEMDTLHFILSGSYATNLRNPWRLPSWRLLLYNLPSSEHNKSGGILLDRPARMMPHYYRYLVGRYQENKSISHITREELQARAHGLAQKALMRGIIGKLMRLGAIRKFEGRMGRSRKGLRSGKDVAGQKTEEEVRFIVPQELTPAISHFLLAKGYPHKGKTRFFRNFFPTIKGTVHEAAIKQAYLDHFGYPLQLSRSLRDVRLALVKQRDRLQEEGGENNGFGSPDFANMEPRNAWDRQSEGKWEREPILSDGPTRNTRQRSPEAQLEGTIKALEFIERQISASKRPLRD